MIQRTRLFAKTLTALSALLLALCATPFMATGAQAMGFKSPSGNIFCYLDVFSPQRMDEIALHCMVYGADWDMPLGYIDEEPDCDLDRARMIIMPPEGAANVIMTCHSDVFWPSPLGTISYGSNWSLFNFTCGMGEDGVRCTNSNGGFFHVRRAALQLN